MGLESDAAEASVDARWEQRRYPRRTFDHNIGLLHDGQYVLCRSVDIGEGGLLVVSDRELSVDDRIVVTFLIPGKGYIAIRAMICHVEHKSGQSHAGIEFANIEFGDRRAIRSYVASRT